MPSRPSVLLLAWLFSFFLLFALFLVFHWIAFYFSLSLSLSSFFFWFPFRSVPRRLSSVSRFAFFSFTLIDWLNWFCFFFCFFCLYLFRLRRSGHKKEIKGRPSRKCAGIFAPTGRSIDSHRPLNLLLLLHLQLRFLRLGSGASSTAAVSALVETAEIDYRFIIENLKQSSVRLFSSIWSCQQSFQCIFLLNFYSKLLLNF